MDSLKIGSQYAEIGLQCTEIASTPLLKRSTRRISHPLGQSPEMLTLNSEMACHLVAGSAPECLSFCFGATLKP